MMPAGRQGVSVCHALVSSPSDSDTWLILDEDAAFPGGEGMDLLAETGIDGAGTAPGSPGFETGVIFGLGVIVGVLLLCRGWL